MVHPQLYYHHGKQSQYGLLLSEIYRVLTMTSFFTKQNRRAYKWFGQTIYFAPMISSMKIFPLGSGEVHLDTNGIETCYTHKTHLGFIQNQFDLLLAKLFILNSSSTTTEISKTVCIVCRPVNKLEQKELQSRRWMCKCSNELHVFDKAGQYQLIIFQLNVAQSLFFTCQCLPRDMDFPLSLKLILNCNHDHSIAQFV